MTPEREAEIRSMAVRVWGTRDITEGVRKGLIDLLGLIDELRAERRWVPVGERLPEHYLPVVLAQDGWSCDGKWYMAPDGTWHKSAATGELPQNPSHWFLIPNAPEAT